MTHDKQNTDRYLDNFAVTSRAPRSRKLQLSMVLSMVALFAQLWMGQVSAGHMAQMLSEQFMRGDICSVQDMGTERPDGLPSGHTMGGTLGCPVCSVAAASFTPGSAQAVQEPPPALAVYGALFTSAPPRALRHTNVRPPAQAPPGRLNCCLTHLVCPRPSSRGHNRMGLRPPLFAPLP